MRLHYYIAVLALLVADQVTKAEQLHKKPAMLKSIVSENDPVPKNKPTSFEGPPKAHLQISSIKPKKVHVPPKPSIMPKFYMLLLMLMTAFMMRLKKLPNQVRQQHLRNLSENTANLTSQVDTKILESVEKVLNSSQVLHDLALQSPFQLATIPPISWFDAEPLFPSLTPHWHFKFFEASPDFKAAKTVSEFSHDDWNQLTDTYLSLKSFENVDHAILQDSEALMELVVTKDAEGNDILSHTFLLEAAYRTEQQSLDNLAEILLSVPKENRNFLYNEGCVGLYIALVGEDQYHDLVHRDGRMLDAVADNPFVSDIDLIEISQGQEIHPSHLIAKFYLQDRPLAFNRFMARIPVTDQLKHVLWAMLDNSEKPSRTQLLMGKDFLNIIFRRNDLTSVTSASFGYGSTESKTDYMKYITSRLNPHQTFNEDTYRKKFNKDPTVAKLLYSKMKEISTKKTAK